MLGSDLLGRAIFALGSSCLEATEGAGIELSRDDHVDQYLWGKIEGKRTCGSCDARTEHR